MRAPLIVGVLLPKVYSADPKGKILKAQRFDACFAFTYRVENINFDAAGEDYVEGG